MRNSWKFFGLALVGVIIFTRFFSISMHPKNMMGVLSEVTLVPKVVAAEIYPEFTCPCCGTPLNKEDPCCGAMTGMIRYIDAKVQDGLSEEEVMVSTAKEFGLDRLTKEETQEQIKQSLAEDAPADAPKIVVEEDSKDLGEVKATDGIVSTDFELKNTGESDLVINKMDSSCGCTSAAIIYQGEEGPKFGMAGHGFDNPENWEVAVAPGGTAILRVYYDPNMHPDLTGSVTRTVTVYSNDPVEFSSKVTIMLEQVN